MSRLFVVLVFGIWYTPVIPRSSVTQLFRLYYVGLYVMFCSFYITLFCYTLVLQVTSSPSVILSLYHVRVLCHVYLLLCYTKFICYTTSICYISVIPCSSVTLPLYQVHLLPSRYTKFTCYIPIIPCSSVTLPLYQVRMLYSRYTKFIFYTTFSWYTCCSPLH